MLVGKTLAVRLVDMGDIIHLSAEKVSSPGQGPPSASDRVPGDPLPQDRPDGGWWACT
jgi:hypothetical protein